MKYPNLIEHFEMILSSLQGELYGEAMATTATFKMRLAELEAQLSEFRNGLPIEKAKIDGTEYNWFDGEEWRIIYYRQLEPKGWTDGTSTEKREGFYSWTETNFIEPKIVYPLPSTETEGE